MKKFLKFFGISCLFVILAVAVVMVIVICDSIRLRDTFGIVFSAVMLVSCILGVLLYAYYFKRIVTDITFDGDVCTVKTILKKYKLKSNNFTSVASLLNHTAINYKDENGTLAFRCVSVPFLNLKPVYNIDELKANFTNARFT